MDSINWQQKYMDEHIKVQDLESKVEIYENITIPRLKEELKSLTKIIDKLKKL